MKPTTDTFQLPVSILNLSVRVSRCLESEKIKTVGDLVQRTAAELVPLRSFGETSLGEITKKLDELGLTLKGEFRQKVIVVLNRVEVEVSVVDGVLHITPDGGSWSVTLDANEVEVAVTSRGGSGADLNMPISCSDLGVRSRNCLRYMEIRTFGDLVRHTEVDLLRRRNFGINSLNEVRSMLARKGLSMDAE